VEKEFNFPTIRGDAKFEKHYLAAGADWPYNEV
jgi:hypothetical protein